MLNEIFGQIKGYIGLTFLLAGLFPAALIIMGWQVYREGLYEIFNNILNYDYKNGEIKISIVFMFISWFLLGMLFVALRGFILYMVECVPGRALAPLRYLLEKRMLSSRQQAYEQKEYYLWLYTVLNWHKYSESFANPLFLPPFIKKPSEYKAIEASALARRVLEYIADERYCTDHIPNYSQSHIIKDGLSQLYAYGTMPSEFLNTATSYQKEIDSWRKLTQQSNVVVNILDLVAESVHRDFVMARNTCSHYPDKGKWIKPTAMGNHMSALDDYAEMRYGIDTATIWLRLWWIIPENDKKSVLDAKLQVESLMNFSVSLAILFFLIITAEVVQIFYLDFNRAELSGISLIMLLSILVVGTRLIYKSAVYATRILQERIVSLIDLNRHKLLAAMGYIPETVEEELKLFQELHTFFTQSKQRSNKQKIKF